jgi:hypothetical protein
MLRLLLVVLAALVLTALTEIGGIVLLATLAVARLLHWRKLPTTALFLAAYAGATLFVVPPLAAFGGRVPLPCTTEPLRALPVLCALNRHYVAPQLLDLSTDLARSVADRFPGSITVALDAGFPFLDGVPLLPHLSHDDGRKLDLGYFYADAGGNYLPGATRSPIGYWAFEQPAPGEAPPCPSEWLTARWDMGWLQPVMPNLKLEPERTRFALDWLFEHAEARGLQRVFLEPYLAKRLGVSSPLLGFQGCRAARHDDHIHLQVD